MKAIRVHKTGDPAVMKLEDVSDPTAGPGQVVVKIHAAGVNPVDTYIRAGRYPAVTLPYTPGSDGAGVVESVGDGVKGLAVGQRVYVYDASGTYAEKVVCDAARARPLPDNVSCAQGAGVGVPYGTAYRALFQKAHALPGEVVLVHGASGGVGTAAVQIARAAGLTVIGTAGTPDGMALVREQGAHHALDHHDPGYLDQVMAITDGRGVDVVLEMLANVNLDRDLGIIARNGRIVIIGSRGRVEIDPRGTMGKDATITGMLLMAATTEQLSSIHAAVGAGLENGSLKPIVGRELPLGEVARAHEAVMEPGAHGKIVLLP